ncbi:hypothetical protein L4D09_08975 [Photobacterium makurazakiensis]|uniref:hypothetical protein n=1 Tax=Photobacterium makurazakiensis TaxID=2910234 RepID=UPI003D14EA44
MHLEQLYSAYLGERYGIAFFSAFAQKYSDDNHINKWQLLIQVEEITAKKLKDGLIQRGFNNFGDEQAMQDKGIRDAEQWVHLEWNTLLKTLIPWVKPYAIKYREQALAATEHQELYQLVQQHEDAIYDFLLSEKQKVDTGIAILEDFIASQS